MSDLIVITFDGDESAEAAYAKVQELQTDLVIDLAGLALVKVDEKGKTHVTTPGSNAFIAAGATGGGFFGMLIGLLFFVPVAGLVLGGLVGALFAGLDKSGVNEEFRAQVKNAVDAGRSAVVIYSRSMTEDKFAKALEPLGGTLIKTSLSDEDERVLAEDLK
jgi:uncharacterized membrane protein